ncbi:E3 ubiquitin ligase BIG BROTHER [Platanthera guangdongensis]|uniref:RING-type E3 ubiquitin transferase n=1 Tax=Platanthera guangdongensis TaxID=2320717 RepID=A0ABR2LFN3_9ASPA
MDEKTPYGVACSRASSSHAGKSSKLFSTSADHQKPLPSKVNQLLPVAQRSNRVKNIVPKRIPKQLETSGSKATTPKTTRVREAFSFLDNTNSANHQYSIEDREQVRREPGCRSLYAPTFSFTQRLIASRDAKKATKNCTQGAKTGTKNGDSKRNSSSISNAIPSVCSQSISSPNRRETTTITRSFSASSKRKLSGSTNCSRMMNKSIIDHRGLIKPPEHSDAGIILRRHARGNPFHDQHEELRMDIDDMSYEELLDLSEKIGSVSTGLTDEALEKCVLRSSFKLPISQSGNNQLIEDGNRCSICQEECDDGEEIGTLACGHWYHPVCIQYWLRQKNWCPICKAPASVDIN